MPTLNWIGKNDTVRVYKRGNWSCFYFTNGGKYYMVFQSKEPGYEGTYSYDRFMEIVKML